MKRVSRLIAILFIFMCAASSVSTAGATWRQASEKELRGVIPARAPVERERIETEFRTASGITDGSKFIAGVTMITAGYAAEGKYSHFFVTQVPLRVGRMTLSPGEYVFGFKRTDDVLEVSFYEAATGRPLGAVSAARDPRRVAVRSLTIGPPAGGKGTIHIGRFFFEYSLS